MWKAGVYLKSFLFQSYRNKKCYYCTRSPLLGELYLHCNYQLNYLFLMFGRTAGMSERGNHNHMGTNHPREPFPLQITLTLWSPPKPIDVFPTSAAKITLRTVFVANREKKLSKDELYAYQHTYLQTWSREGHFLVICTAKHVNPRRHRGRLMQPLGFSENNSRTDRPIVAKLGIPIHWTILHLFLKISRPYLLWLLNCDLISKVMSSEIYVPYRFNAWNLRTSVFLRAIWTWIDVARWRPWLTLTLWPFRGQSRSSEVNDLWWRHKSFFGFLCPQG